MTKTEPSAGLAAYAKSEELYKKFEKRLLRYLKSSTGDVAVAEDISQELWVRVLQHDGQFEDNGRVESWLFTIARNLVIDYRRKPTMERLDYLSKKDREAFGDDGDDGSIPDDKPKLPCRPTQGSRPSHGNRPRPRNSRPRPFEPPDSRPTPEARLLSVEEREKIDPALLQLDTLYREVLVLRFHEGLTLGEIAEKTNTPLSTVKARLYRGLAAVKPKLTRIIQG